MTFNLWKAKKYEIRETDPILSCKQLSVENFTKEKVGEYKCVNIIRGENRKIILTGLYEIIICMIYHIIFGKYLSFYSI